MNRKYLDEIGFTDRPDLWNPNDQRQEAWELQRNKYGFDEREIWSVDLTFLCWLYERLMFYRQHAAFDFNYHQIEYKGKIYTQGELIDEMIRRLENYFQHSAEYDEDVDEVAFMWAGIMPLMWT
jgi:hypothetical protein